MPRGGYREGAGRKAGSRIVKTAEIAGKLATDGLTPLEYILSIMRDGKQSQEIRLECAKSAAPYMHARINAIAATATPNGQISKEEAKQLLHDAWDAIEQNMRVMPKNNANLLQT